MNAVLDKKNLLALTTISYLLCGILTSYVGMTIVAAQPTTAANDKYVISDPKILDYGTNKELPAAVEGQRVTLLFRVEDNMSDTQLQDYVVVLEIRDANGVTIYAGWKPGHLETERVQNISFKWLPLLQGSFNIRTFVISSFDNPEALSRPKTSSIMAVHSIDDLQKFTDQSSRQESPDASNIGNQNNDEIEQVGVPGKKVKYTVLVYMVASNLESQGYFATDDLEEMLKIGSTLNVNIIVQTGGSANSTIDERRFIDFTKVQRHLILKDKISTIQDLNRRNMAAENTLKEFIGWGITKYPAERYAIILWDHGAGLLGFGYDDIHNDTLTLSELGGALNVAKDSGKEFELIGFDACLMASLEVANKVSAAGNYLVASEEVEPAWGWDYSAILGSLSDNPDQDGKALGKVIADSYISQTKAEAALYENYESQRGLTLSVINLEKIPLVVELADEISDHFDAHLGDRKETYGITRTIHGTEHYGDSGKSSSGHLDLYHFAENLDIHFTELKGIGQGIKSAIADAVVYNVNGNAKPDAHGISIYMEVSEYEGNAPYLRYIVGSWVSVLEKARAVLDEDTLPPVIDLSMKQDANKSIVGKIKAEDASTASIFFTQDSPDSKYKLNILSIIDEEISDIVEEDGESVRFVWDEKIISLCNEEEQDCKPTSIWFESNGKTKFAFIPARLESERFNGTLVLIYTVEIDDNNQKFDFIGGWPGIDEYGNAARELLPLISGDKLYTTTFVLSYDPTADETYLDEIENDSYVLVGENFGPMYRNYPGEYHIVIAACDFSGNCGYSPEFKFNVS